MVCFMFISFGVSAQMNDTLYEPTGPQYLLLDKGLQFRITESVNSMYNFDFKTAERGFLVLKYTYPQHPLPDFLIGLSQWWKIAPNMEDTRHDKRFIAYMDSAIYKAEKILKKDPEKEAFCDHVTLYFSAKPLHQTLSPPLNEEGFRRCTAFG